MLLTFILGVIGSFILSIFLTRLYINSQEDNDWFSLLFFITTIASWVFFLSLFCAGGLGGEMGFSTYKETSITNFSKSLSSDHNSMIIIYEDRPYLFNEYKIVNNFNKTTNVVIKEKISVLGVSDNWELTPIIPPQQNYDK